MRSTERLIRQLTNARISIVHDEQRTALKRVRETHKMSEVPKPVQAAVARLAKLDAEERSLKSQIEKAGYKSYHLSGGTLYRNNADAEKAQANRGAEARIATLEALRAEAVIDTIGTTPEQAKAALVAFRSAILKV